MVLCEIVAVLHSLPQICRKIARQPLDRQHEFPHQFRACRPGTPKNDVQRTSFRFSTVGVQCRDKFLDAFVKTIHIREWLSYHREKGGGPAAAAPRHLAAATQKEK